MFIARLPPLPRRHPLFPSRSAENAPSPSLDRRLSLCPALRRSVGRARVGRRGLLAAARRDPQTLPRMLAGGQGSFLYRLRPPEFIRNIVTDMYADALHARYAPGAHW